MSVPFGVRLDYGLLLLLFVVLKLAILSRGKIAEAQQETRHDLYFHPDN